MNTITKVFTTLALLLTLPACEPGDFDGLGETGEFIEPVELGEIVCTRFEGQASCAVRAGDTETFVTHLTQPCADVAPEITRNEIPSLPGWLVQEPVPAIDFIPADVWPDSWFACAAGEPIDAPDGLENVRCGKACESCIVRCAAELDGYSVMIAPSCKLSSFTAEPSDFPACDA